MSKVLIVCLNPTFQKTYMFENFILGEVNRELFHLEDASGKGINVSRVLTQKKISNAIISHLCDKDEKRMLDLIKKDNINLKYVLDEDSRVRTCSTILTQSGLTTELVEESNKVNEKTDQKIRDLFDKEILDCDYLLITGTRSPNYKEDIYQSFVEKARNLKKYVIVDIVKDELKRCIKYGPNIIKPNLSEFMKTFYNEDVLESEDDEYCKDKFLIKVEELYKDYGINSVVTRGVKPIWVYENGNFYEVEVEKALKCVNTVGCGDTLSASLIANLSEGFSLKEALISASKDAKLNALSLRPGSLI